MIKGDSNVIMFPEIHDPEEFRSFIEYFTSHVYIITYENTDDADDLPPSFSLLKTAVEEKIVEILNEIDPKFVTYGDNGLSLNIPIVGDILQQFKNKIDVHILISGEMLGAI